jgi:hypothetical protein
MSDTATTESVSAPAPEVAAPETFSLDYVQGLRQEAAKYRTERNDAVEKAKAEVIRDYEGQLSERESAFNELKGELTVRDIELLKLKAVVSEGIPTEDILDVTALIQGSDEATISESVKRVKSLLDKAPTRERPVDPSQGSGNVLPLNGDPLLDMVKRVVGA